jgi:outer membrane assembly lipoprotein YfiO
VSVWQFSDYAPQAQYLIGRCHEAKREDEAAFNAYQKLVERYPKVVNYDEVLLRQMTIANRFLAGQWYKLFNLVPFFASMDKTIKLYEKIIKNGPHSEVAPQAQVNIGKAHENKTFKEYPEAVRAYEKAADRYSDQKVGKEALFLVGETYYKQASRADYDQSVAGQSIATFTDFITLHPDDARVSEATKKITTLKLEQARGAMEIAKYYERNHKWEGAKIYYNAVVDTLRDKPDQPQVQEALRRIESINKRITGTK